MSCRGERKKKLPNVWFLGRIGYGSRATRVRFVPGIWAALRPQDWLPADRSEREFGHHPSRRRAIDSAYSRGQFTVLSRGYDMMKKAHEEAAAYRLHFKRCLGVGICEEIGHPGGPRRSRSQALTTPMRAASDIDDVGDASVDSTPTRPALAMPAEVGALPPVPPAVEREDVVPAEGARGWIDPLFPVHEVASRPIGPTLALKVVSLTFDLWDGPRLHMQEDCNKRGGRVVGDQGELSCAEVEIVKRLRRAGWEAGWFQAFRCGRRRWSAYVSEAHQLPDVVRAFSARLARKAGTPM